MTELRFPQDALARAGTTIEPDQLANVVGGAGTGTGRIARIFDALRNLRRMMTLAERPRFTATPGKRRKQLTPDHVWETFGR